MGQCSTLMYNVTVTQWGKVFDVGGRWAKIAFLQWADGPWKDADRWFSSGKWPDDGSDLNWAKIYLPEIKGKARSHRLTEDSLRILSFRRDGGGTSRSWSKLSNPVWIGACGEVISTEICMDSKVCRLCTVTVCGQLRSRLPKIDTRAQPRCFEPHTRTVDLLQVLPTTHNVAGSLWRSSQDVSTRSVTIIRDDTSRRNVLPKSFFRIHVSRSENHPSVSNCAYCITMRVVTVHSTLWLRRVRHHNPSICDQQSSFDFKVTSEKAFKHRSYTDCPGKCACTFPEVFCRSGKLTQARLPGVFESAFSPIFGMQGSRRKCVDLV